MEDKKSIKVGVLFGGKSSEKEISLATGRYIFNLIDPLEFEAIPIYMDTDGLFWQLPLKLLLKNTTKDIEGRIKEDSKKIDYEDLKNYVDFVFITLLGKYGEDGAVQGLLELLKIPYSGSGILASSVAMHKRVSKDLFKSDNVLVPKDISILKEDYEHNKEKVFEVILERVGFPCVVKPVMEGSSVGVSSVRAMEDLDKSLQQAFLWDSEILVEEFIRGKEFMCVVIGNEEPVAMQPSEVVFSGDIFTYESKYMPGKAKYYTPIRTTPEKIEEIRSIAVRIYKIFGIKGYGRVDGFLTEEGRIYISESHTGTIMVPSSYVFQQSAMQDIVTKTKSGIKANTRLNPRKLISAIIYLGIEVHSNKKGTL